MATRWNFRLGPLQFTSPVGVIGGSVIAGFVLCCCGAGIIGMFSDDSPDSPPPAITVVETSTPATPAAPATLDAAVPSATAQVVTAGAFCDTAGQTGVTKTGLPVVCRGPGALRWRQP